MLDLGLRSAEVAALRLEDVDWVRGVVSVKRSKSRRADLLPLPPTMGRAVADYLRLARPRTASRALFVRHTAPVGSPVAIRSVGNAVRYAARRAGISARCRGPHTLRRTMATRLLRTGATLKEVADVLRHGSLDTTALYAKVDRRTLDAVAMAWPGGAS
jgi:integrase